MKANIKIYERSIGISKKDLLNNRKKKKERVLQLLCYYIQDMVYRCV